MKHLIILFLFLFSCTVFGQLHHSMVSVQSSYTDKYDINVLQSVGQLSLIGNFSSSKVSVIQGFQQPFIRYITEYIINVTGNGINYSTKVIKK